MGHGGAGARARAGERARASGLVLLLFNVEGEEGGGWLPRNVGHNAATVLTRHLYLFRFYLVDHPATESFLYLL